MQIAQVVTQSVLKREDAKKVDRERFRLKFYTRSEKVSAPPVSREQAAQWAKSRWLGRMGGPDNVKRIRTAPKTRTNP